MEVYIDPYFRDETFYVVGCTACDFRNDVACEANLQDALKALRTHIELSGHDNKGVVFEIKRLESPQDEC